MEGKLCSVVRWWRGCITTCLTDIHFDDQTSQAAYIYRHRYNWGRGEGGNRQMENTGFWAFLRFPDDARSREACFIQFTLNITIEGRTRNCCLAGLLSIMALLFPGFAGFLSVTEDWLSGRLNDRTNDGTKD